MKTNAALKWNVLPPRRVNLHAVKAHAPEPQWPYPRPSALQQWMLDFGYPILFVVGVYFAAPLLTIAAISGYLDRYLAPFFKMLGI